MKNDVNLTKFKSNCSTKGSQQNFCDTSLLYFMRKMRHFNFGNLVPEKTNFQFKNLNLLKVTATTTRVVGTDMYCPSCDLFFENITGMLKYN